VAIPTTFACCNSINIFKFEALHRFSMGIHSAPRYGSFDTFSHSGKTKKRWDPIETLEIINPDRNCLTCVGYAPSCGRRCRNPINQANRASAFQLLKDLENIDPSTTNIQPQLCRLAGLTLCLRYHQNQVGAVVDEWMSVLPVRNSFKMEETDDSDDELGHLSRNELERMVKEMKEMLERDRKRQEDKDREKREREREREHEEKERREKERQEKECQEKERQEKERQDKEQEKKERRERRRQEKEREEKERQERERKQREEEEKQREREERKKREKESREKEEQERKEKERRETEERNERVRQRAQRAKEERERKEREKAERERKEWDEIWLLYSKRWDGIKSMFLAIKF